MIICRTSWDEAFQTWKAQQRGHPVRYKFADELGKACTQVQGKKLFKGSTLGKYIRDDHKFTKQQAGIILQAAQSLGVQLRCKGQKPGRRIVDHELLNLSIDLEKLDRDNDQPIPNRIEPDQAHKLRLSGKVDHGLRRIEFGEAPDKPSLYTAEIKVKQGSINIQTSKSGTARLEKPEKETFRESGDPKDLRSMSWVLEDLPEQTRTIEGDLGIWQGHFAATDVANFTVSREHLEPQKFRRKFGDQLADKDIAATMTPDLALAIEKRIEDVLKTAFRDQTSERLTLASVPLFPDLEEEG